MFRAIVRQLIRHTAGYGFNTLVGPIFTILLTPIYTRILTKADYGTVDTLLVLNSLLAQLGNVGLRSALVTFYYHPKHSHEQDQIVTSTLWAGVIWSLLLATLTFLSAAPLTKISLNRTDVTWLVCWIAISLPFNTLYSLQTAIFQLRFAIWRANLTALIYILISVSTNILLIVVLGWGSSGVIIASTTAIIIGGLASIALAPKNLFSLPKISLMWNLVQTGIPLVPAGIAIWVLAYQDRLFLVRFVSLSELGIYAIANKLVSMLTLLVEPFKAAWNPLALSIQQQKEAPRTYAKILTYFSAGGLGIGLALSLFAYEILLIFTTKEYVEAANYVWLLVLMPLTSGLHSLVGIGLLIDKRTGQLGWTIAVAAIINTALNFLLIPPFGVWGAAIATAFGYFATPLLTAFVAQHYHPLPFAWGKIFIIFGVYGFLVILGLIVGHTSASLVWRALLLLVYLPLLGFFGVFEAREIQLLEQVMRQPKLVFQWLAGRK